MYPNSTKSFLEETSYNNQNHHTPSPISGTPMYVPAFSSITPRDMKNLTPEFLFPY